ncbi:TonB-dependent receptor [Asticcacaulis sp. DXS10W]|uniref:TonB-dependent receptor n=1 Tax=Asticcacaulis currens TaxID=2984210 RepID=A0ABT5IC30_9CAUL|nr:TonB-dependent receptor [Asticcacaulis currens]MDC7693740.1 TonB-dependent receptor [Asticcacaulis currens]
MRVKAHTHNRFSLNRTLMVTCSGMVMALGAAAALTPAAQAQNAQAQTEEEPQVITVTAQKREQSLQDVPIVVTTLSAKLLQDAGVKDIKDMQVLTPGLTVTSTQNESLTTARIRGVGTVGDNPGMESSVGVVIDGVYRPRNGVGFGDLGEIGRIEVLKGPQGTLFGKNTSAGVINIITKEPAFVFGMDGEATVSNYDGKGVSASITGPLSEDLVAGRLFVAKRERGGFYDVNTGIGPRTLKEDADQNFYTVRGQLLFTPGAHKIRVIADYSKRDENCCATVQTRTGPTGAALNTLAAGNGVAATANPEARLAYSNRPTTQQITDGGVSVEANIKLAWLDSTLTSVTGVRKWKNTNGQDIDYSGADILYRRDNGDFKANFDTFSQELRLAGATDKLNWLVGAFYADEDLKRTDSYVYGTQYETYLSILLAQALGLPTTTPTVSVLTGRAPGTSYTPGQGALDYYTQESKSLALFTNNGYKFTDQFEVTLGLRYTQETKKMTAIYTNSDGGVGCASALGRSGLLGNAPVGAWATIPAAARPTVVGNMCTFWGNAAFNNRRVSNEVTEKEWSGTLKGAYRFNENVMAYASYARGYKGGGYNLDRAQTGITPDSTLYFKPETVDSYELGLKTSMMNNKLLFNITAFDQTYQDFQLNTFLGTAFVVESIPELKSKGVDADIYWSTPIRGLSVQGGIAYADTKYGSFKASDLSNPARFPQLSLLPGARMSFAPELTGSLAVTWSGNIAENLRASGNIAAKYSSEYNTGSDLIPYKMQDGYTLLNARFGIGAPDQAWTLEFWAQNLTDETYKQVVINAPLQGNGFQSTVQPNGTYYNQALDSNTYDAFMGQPRTYGVTLRVKY